MRKSKVLTTLYVLLLILMITSTFFLNLMGYIGNQYSFSKKYNVKLDSPIVMTQAPGDNSFVYVGEKAGKILKIENTAGASHASVFLDLTDVVVVTNEDGLLGMAFHPDYPQVPKFYEFHSELGNCSTPCFYTVLSAYNVSNGVAQRDSQVELLRIFQDNLYHRSGTINFGSDGFLYVHVGDGSNQTRAQQLSNIYGSILRIDVNHPTNSTMHYGIPADNPFVNTPHARPEIYAYGMRNPFRGDFDRKTGDYWFGDVGNALYEEVDHLQKGGNYEWPLYEGNHCRTCTNSTRWNKPLLAYPHPEQGSEKIGIQFEFQNLNRPYGIAIVGTTVYRGTEFNKLQGYLIMTDYLGLVYQVDTQDASTAFVGRVPTIVAQVYQDVKSNELYFVGIGVLEGDGGIYTMQHTFPIIQTTLLILISLMILLPILMKYRKNSNTTSTELA